MSERKVFRCTDETPFNPELIDEYDYIEHERGYEYGDIADEVALMKCKSCGCLWKEMIPQ